MGFLCFFNFFIFHFPFPLSFGAMPPVVAFAVGSASPANVPLVAPYTFYITRLARSLFRQLPELLMQRSQLINSTLFYGRVDIYIDHLPPLSRTSSREGSNPCTGQLGPVRPTNRKSDNAKGPYSLAPYLTVNNEHAKIIMWVSGDGLQGNDFSSTDTILSLCTRSRYQLPCLGNGFVNTSPTARQNPVPMEVNSYKLLI